MPLPCSGCGCGGNGEATALFELRLSAERPAGTLELSIAQEDGFAVMEPVYVPVTGRVLPTIEAPRPPGGLPVFDLPGAARQVIRHDGRVVAELHFARTGDALKLKAHVLDAVVEHTDQVWDGSCLEIFGAMPDNDKVGQVLLAPATAQRPAAAYRANPRGPQHDERMAVASRLEDGGYVIEATVPLEEIGLDPAAPVVRIEFQVSGVPEAGEQRAWATCFGSTQAYQTPLFFAYFVTGRP